MKSNLHRRARRFRLALAFSSAGALSFLGLRWGDSASDSSAGPGVASSVRAFSSGSSFGAGPLQGAGGRYFTGSLRDGFTCGVCHESTEFFDFKVEGLPKSLTPGKSYDVTVSWEGDPKRVYLNGEFVGAKGTKAGTLDAGEKGKEEIRLYPLKDEREIFVGRSPQKREKSQLRFRWKAPESSFKGPISLHIAGVRRQAADESEDILKNDELAIFSRQFSFANSSSDSSKGDSKE